MQFFSIIGCLLADRIGSLAAVAEASPAFTAHPGPMELIDLRQDAYVPTILQQQPHHTNNKFKVHSMVSNSQVQAQSEPV
jgi:hypothetical protein